MASVTAFDQLREKWERITPRERNLVLALGSTLILVLVISIGMMIGDGLAAIDKGNAEKREALRAMAQYRASGGAQAEEKPIVASPTPIKLDTFIEGVANEVGVTIPEYNRQPGATRGTIQESSNRIRMSGITVYELKDFLQRLESKSKSVIVSSLQIKRNFREKEKLDVDMTVTAFYEPQEGEGAGAGEAAGAGEDG